MASDGKQHSKRMGRRFRRQTEPGTVPGLIVPDPEALPSRVRLMHYDQEACAEQVMEDFSELKQMLNKPGVHWVDITGLADAKLISEIGELFGFHSLSLEDVVNVHQRSKVEMYQDCLFMVARSPKPDHLSETLQVAMFLGPDYVVTFQEGGCQSLEAVRQRILKAQGRIRSSGADFLLYSLLDSIIDEYFPVLESHGELLDILDEKISESSSRDAIHQIHEIRSDLLAIRRTVWPHREMVNALIRDSGDLVSDETDLYLRDSYDHLVQLIDVIETDRELCTDLRDYYLTVVSNRMNQGDEVSDNRSPHYSFR